MIKYGVTHTSPDMDAIGAAWLVSKYFELGCKDWVFISQKQSEDPSIEEVRQDTLKAALTVVDVGMIHDPATSRYDHHQLSWNYQRNTCAMKMVWEQLMFQGHGYYEYLRPLVEFVTKGDTGVRTPEMVVSYTFGLHAELSHVKRNDRLSDAGILDWGFNRLDIINDLLLHEHYLQKDLESKVFWQSDDDKVICLRNGSGRLARKALESCDLVIFINEEADTNTFGIQRKEELPFSCFDIVEMSLEATDDEVIMKELRSWYHHKSGFFSGRGTHGAKSVEPIPWKVVPTMLYLFDTYYRRLV